MVNSLRPAREGGRVVRGKSEFILSCPHPPYPKEYLHSCREQCGVGGGGGLSLLPSPSLTLAQPYLHSCSKTQAHNKQYRIQNTGNRIQNKETCVNKISNVPLFYMELGLNDFDAEKSITRAVERGGGPLKWIFLHQNHNDPRQVNSRYINSYYLHVFRKFSQVRQLPGDFLYAFSGSKSLLLQCL